MADKKLIIDDSSQKGKIPRPIPINNVASGFKLTTEEESEMLSFDFGADRGRLVAAEAVFAHPAACHG